MSKKKKPTPQVIILDTPAGKEEYDIYLFRIVDCDDGVKRLEPLKPTDIQHLSEEDSSKNHFVTGYVHNSLSKVLGW